MRLRLDPWAAEYNTAYHAEVIPDAHDGVDTGVEVAANDWRAVRPERPLAISELIFLDGSRRVDARLLLEGEGPYEGPDEGPYEGPDGGEGPTQGDEPLHAGAADLAAAGGLQVAFGALGRYGVGAVRCCAGEAARFLDAWEIEGICALSSGRVHPDLELPVTSPHHGPLRFRVVSTPERDPDAVVRLLQREMRAAEARLAARLADAAPRALILTDGPRPLLAAQWRVLGYVKTIHDVKIPAPQLQLVRRLEQGERSPLYLVRTSDPARQYFEWFLRLRDPRPWLYSLAGMVRLQAYAGSDPAAELERARQLADWSCVALPRFASLAHQDPRAPQQLLPVRALEGELRRRMGDGQLIRRRLTRFLAAQEERG